MTIQVVGHRVLIKLDDVTDEEVQESGLIVKRVESTAHLKAAFTEAVVVGVGPDCWKDPQFNSQGPWCKVGDRIGFARYSMNIIRDPNTKEEFAIINDHDVQYVVKGE